MKKVIIKFGLYSSAIIVAVMLFSVAFVWKDADTTVSMIVGFLSMILAFSLIVVAIKQYKKSTGTGRISFKDAFLIGFFISLITSTFYVATWMITTEVKPEIVDDMYTMFENQTKNSGLPDAVVEAKLEEFAAQKEKYKNPMYKAGITYTEILPVGILLSLIIALVFYLMDRKKSDQEPELSGNDV